MALTNIFNEPRREITETIVGLGVFVPLLCGDFYLSKLLQKTDPSLGPFVSYLILVPAMLVIALLIISGLLVVIHRLGESICNVLDRKGLHLRPHNRS